MFSPRNIYSPLPGLLVCHVHFQTPLYSSASFPGWSLGPGDNRKPFLGGPGFPTADPDKALRSWRPSQQKNQMNSVKNSLLPENLSMELAFFLESQGYGSGLHTRQLKSPQTHILLTSQNRSLARRMRALPLRVR